MRNLDLALLRCLCGFMLCTASFTVSAQEVEPTKEEQLEDEQQISKILKDLLEENGSYQYTVAGEALTEEERQESKIVLPEEEEPSDEETTEDNVKIQAAFASVLRETNATRNVNLSSIQKLASSIYVTLHPGAYFRVLDTWYGNVRFNDWSVWTTSTDHAWIINGFLPNDVVYITKNHEWFSSYAYRLSNQTTNVSIPVNLSLFISYINPTTGFPQHNGDHRRIIGFNYNSRQILMDNGDEFSVLPHEYSLNWQVGQTVIYGINDGWYQSTRPNILINADRAEHVKAVCVRKGN